LKVLILLETEVYNDRGLSDSSSQRRSVTWTPQKADSIINGELIFKDREKLTAGVSSITLLSFDYEVVVGVQTIGITTTDGTFSGIST